jgi:spoIIIJ-associated protein
MSERREFEGRDLDEAVRTAAAALGVPAAEVHYELLDEGRRGVFGLGARLVRIAVEVTEAPAAPGPLESEAEEEAGEPAARRPATSDLTAVETTVRRMLVLMGMKLEARVHPVEGGIRIELAGPDRKLLAQKDGELVSALQFLLNRMARRSWPDRGHIQIDCEGFRNKREEDLVELAREVARQVARTGRPKRLHSMNPYERRLVHLTVREFPGLTTRSEGEGFLKQVTVEPARPGPTA